MKLTFPIIILNSRSTKLFLLSFIILVTGAVNAATVNYSLENVFFDNNQQMTGTFQWTYQEGDFENGVGLFTDLFIPGHESGIDALTINFDIAKSIEFSLTANLHNEGVNVTLFLDGALTPTQGADLDLSRSAYEIVRVGRGGFVSGAISPSLVPIPAAFWLFLSGLLSIICMLRHNKSDFKKTAL
jgi:hypothetical protein